LKVDHGAIHNRDTAGRSRKTASAEAAGGWGRRSDRCGLRPRFGSAGSQRFPGCRICASAVDPDLFAGRPLWPPERRSWRSATYDAFYPLGRRFGADEVALLDRGPSAASKRGAFGQRFPTSFPWITGLQLAIDLAAAGARLVPDRGNRSPSVQRRHPGVIEKAGSDLAAAIASAGLQSLEAPLPVLLRLGLSAVTLCRWRSPAGASGVGVGSALSRSMMSRHD